MAGFAVIIEGLGLLSRVDIGFKGEWLRLLSERNLRIVGHGVCEGTGEVNPDAGIIPAD